MRIKLTVDSKLHYRFQMPEIREPEIRQQTTRIPGSLQILIFLESIPYFITVGITQKLIALVLSHSRLEWDDIFKWRCFCFAIFSFLLLSLANYGDRISNGRFYIFTVFLLISYAWTPLVIAASTVDTILVFSSCLQPLLIVREASRMCFVVQPLLISRRITGIRFFFFLLFLFANLGAFFFVIALKNLKKPQVLAASLFLQPVYLLLVGATFMFGGNVVAHRNIVERGFKCLVKKFEQLFKRIFSPICKCLRKRKSEDYRSMYDGEIVTCTECMLQLSKTLAPFVLFFATVEMTFYTWVRDYDVTLDLGYAEWEITLSDIYHGFNIVTALLIYLIILPLVQSSVSVHDGVLLCIAYFVLLLCWLSASSLQYVNEQQQTPPPYENRSQLVIFSNLETQTLVDSVWTKKQWLSSGDVVISKIKLTHLEASSSAFALASLYQNVSQPKKLGSITLRSIANATFCYLLTSANGNVYLKKYEDTLNHHFLQQSKSKPEIVGYLFTLCSVNLFNGPPYFLDIQHLRTREMKTIPICKNSPSITNLTVGWYVLFLRQNASYVSFEMLVGIQKEALHYLYIEKESMNFSEFKGKVTNLVSPFFHVDTNYFLIPMGLFAIAFTLGIVSLHSFVLCGTPRHLHEFGFAIMYTTWSLGGGVAGLSFRYFCAHSRGMFFWVLFVVTGLLLFIRNVLVFIVHPHPCSPDGWVLADVLAAQAQANKGDPPGEERDPVEEVNQKQTDDSRKLPAQTASSQAFMTSPQMVEPSPPAPEPPPQYARKAHPLFWKPPDERSTSPKQTTGPSSTSRSARERSVDELSASGRPRTEKNP